MIPPDTTVAHYRVESLIGSGGMGEVYQAVDTRLERRVALKVLPSELSHSRERLRRFVQEAKAASSLNHPHILTVYDAGEAEIQSNGIEHAHFIASELIVGKTLRDLIHRERIPLKRVVSYLAQAADGIAKAHAAGIIHRDLKPDNIMVTDDGFAKVLDFGLAKLTESAQEQVTLPDRTREGLVLGTVAYMSPEQAQGKRVDHRSDIFAFGAILYEAAARRPAFSGDSDPDILHRIIHEEPPPLDAVPGELDRLVVRSMAKDPDERIQSMKDVALELRDISRSFESLRIQTAPRRRPLRARGWLAITAAAFVIGGLAGYLWKRPVRAVEPIRFALDPPGGTFFTATPNSATALQFAVSPNGKSIAFVASAPSAKSVLWLRDLSSVEARPLAGTEGAWFPFWSPNGDAVAFFADGKLKRIATSGGTPAVLADAQSPRGGAWGREGVILFAPTSAGPIYRVSESGGDIAPATSLSASRHERGHRWPHFLPDGRRFLYMVLSGDAARRGMYLGSLGTTDARLVLSSSESNIDYAEPGKLLFVRRGGLYAQTVNARTLASVGELELIEQRIGYAPTLFYGAFSASSHDLIAYASRVNANRRLTWFDRHGRVLGTVAEPGDWGTASMSIHADKALLTRADPASGNLDLWIVDLARGTASPLTTDPADENHPVWSPDGKALVFTSNRGGLPDMYLKTMGAPGEELLLTASSALVPMDWSADGRSIIYEDRNSQTGTDLWVLEIGQHAPLQPLIRTPFNESEGKLSPEGRWLAYSSDDSGRLEVYVRPFLAPGERYQVSVAGGSTPRWSADGKELFFMTPKGEIASARVVENRSRFECAVPEVLFAIPGVVASAPEFRTAYAVSDDGRFLVNVNPTDNAPATITALVHWQR